MKKKLSMLTAVIMALQIVASLFVLPVHAKVSDGEIYTEQQ